MRKAEVLEANGELLRLLDEAVNRYDKRKNKNISVDFYNEVQPAVHESSKKIEMWVEKANQFVMENRPKYLHTSQIDAVKVNLEEVVLQSFFCKIHMKRFKDLSESVGYTLKTLQDYVT